MVTNVLNAKVGASLDILVIAGMRLELGCALTKVDGTPINLEDVQEMYFTVKHCVYKYQVVWQLSLGDGINIIGEKNNVINFSTSVPDDIDAGNYAFDLVYKNSFGYYTLLYGDGQTTSFIVQKNVTNAN